MAGSMGYGNIIDTINRILDKNKTELNIVVICGNMNNMQNKFINKQATSDIVDFVIKNYRKDI